MSSLAAAPDDLTLVEREPAIPSMGALFTPGDLVADLAPHWGVTGAELRYLRYKPGASLTASIELQLPGGARRLVQAIALGPGSAGKLAKIARTGHQDDVGLGAAVDLCRGVALVDATADRALPGVRRFLKERSPGELTPLVYKPGRRWVARHEPVEGTAAIVKIHQPATVPQLLDRHRAMLSRGLPVPPIVARRTRRGLLASALVPGSALDALPPGGRRETLWATTGRVLADLHRGPVPAGLSRGRLTQDLDEAVAAVRAVCPELVGEARAAAELVLGGLADRQLLQLVHGDFSADQVIAQSAEDGPDLTGAQAAASAAAQSAVTLVDLDRVRRDDPLADLGSWYAVEVLTGRAARDLDPLVALEPLLAGYRAAGADVDPRALRLHAAAALLQRAVEPFRCRAPRWSAGVAELVRAAHDLAAR